jgi:hypothetical protein
MGLADADGERRRPAHVEGLTHLSHVFTKLEISTRVELAAAAAT